MPYRFVERCEHNVARELRLRKQECRSDGLMGHEVLLHRWRNMGVIGLLDSFSGAHLYTYKPFVLSCLVKNFMLCHKNIIESIKN
jgi:hypothetical protein